VSDVNDSVRRRHDALVERDRWVGLEAEADAARAHAARLQAKLDVAQRRLDRKNARIKQLVQRIDELEGELVAARSMSSRVRAVVTRVARRR
jgi:peptidoglycan hydrolase CwlO-like protein